MKKAIRAYNQTTTKRGSSAGTVQFVGGYAANYTPEQRDHFCTKFNGQFEEVDVSDELHASVMAGLIPITPPDPAIAASPALSAAETETDLGAGATTEGFDNLPDGTDYGYTVGYCNFHKIEADSRKHADLLEAVEKHRRAAELGISVEDLEEPKEDEEPEIKKEEGTDTSEASKAADGPTGPSDEKPEDTSDKSETDDKK
jgi:hypothetical protein